ncbi:MAG: hypothetical protein KDD76_06970 [Rickettsiales bacterium]|nr:hypothetical protein [Rickettsiales bacterium]
MKAKYSVKLIIISLLGCVMTTACTTKDYIHRKEYYSKMYTAGAQACNWTQITCYAGDKRPENIVYQDNVCRYYLEYGKLSVGKSYDDPLRDVIFTQNGNCTFNNFHNGYAMG